MNDRDRLIELIVNADTYDSYECKLCTKNDVSCRRCGAEKFADYLLANGVTVQEWISVNDRFPDPEQDVILCTREIETYGKHHEKKKIYRNIYMGYFDGEEWLTSYCHGCEYIFRMNEKYPNETIEVTHWMPIPKPPKGE